MDSEADVAVPEFCTSGTTFKIYLPRVEEKSGSLERMKFHAWPSNSSETIQFSPLGERASCPLSLKSASVRPSDYLLVLSPSETRERLHYGFFFPRLSSNLR
jgi:hypothetical protein